MGPRPCTQAPPVTTGQLLALLRRGRLLDNGPLRRLAEAWGDEDEPAPHLDQLVQAGLLTRYQADQLAAGRPGRLRLGPYRLLDRLGAGGMGQVYKAEHVLLRRTVALKLLGRARPQPRRPLPSGVETPTGDRLPTPPRLRRRAAHLREIEAAGRLSHPHVVAAHDACRLRGRLVLVLEYVDGIDLDRLVRESGPLAPGLAREVIRQAALALDYLHGQRLVHRDVKPANLLLTHTPDGAPHVKLLDLGLVCPADEVGDELCGTPDFLAPERGLSAASTDIRSDLYSLGCTLYSLLTGRVPFPGGAWTGKLLRHQIEVPTPVGELRPGVPPGLLRIVERLMARDPAARIATPARLLQELEAPEAEPAALPAPPAPPRRWTWSLVSRLALAMFFVGASAGALARLAWRTQAQDQPAAGAPGGPSLALRAGPPGTESSAKPHAPQRALTSFDLPAALAGAPDGAVIELPVGRYVLPALSLHDKSLTLRAAAGARVVLTKAAGGSWEPLLRSQRELTLEGLELQGGDTNEPPAALVLGEGGTLILRDCVLSQPGAAPAVALRRGSLLRIERCRVVAQAQGIAVEAKGDLVVRDSDLRVADAGGPAVLLWAGESAPAEPLGVSVTGSTIQAGRILALRAITGPVRIEAVGNRFVFPAGLVSLDGYREPDAWRRVLRWRGERNRYEGGGPWLRVGGRPVAARGDGAFEDLWR